MFLSLSDRVPISNQRNVKEHVPLNVKLPKLLSRVECIAALMACIAMDNASSMYLLALTMSGGGSLCNNVLRTFPSIWCILSHTALD
jgi:hypothetical protein